MLLFSVLYSILVISNDIIRALKMSFGCGMLPYRFIFFYRKIIKNEKLIPYHQLNEQSFGAIKMYFITFNLFFYFYFFISEIFWTTSFFMFRNEFFSSLNIYFLGHLFFIFKSVRINIRTRSVNVPMKFYLFRKKWQRFF